MANGEITGLKLNSRGLRDVFEQWARTDGERRMQQVLAKAEASAPVDTGAYRDSLHIEHVTTDRAVVRVVAGTDHAWIVEARTGNLARALDAAGGA